MTTSLAAAATSDREPRKATRSARIHAVAPALPISPVVCICLRAAVRGAAELQALPSAPKPLLCRSRKEVASRHECRSRVSWLSRWCGARWRPHIMLDDCFAYAGCCASTQLPVISRA